MFSIRRTLTIFALGAVMAGCASTGTTLAPTATSATQTSALIVHDTGRAECFVRLHSTDLTVGRSFRIVMQPGASYTWAAVPPGEYEMRGIACYNSAENPNAVSKKITISQGKVNYLGGLMIGEKSISIVGSDPASLSRLRTAIGALGARAGDVVSAFSKTSITLKMANEKIPISVNFVSKEPAKGVTPAQTQAKEDAQRSLRDQVQLCIKGEDERNLVLLGDYELAADHAVSPPKIDAEPKGAHTLTLPFTYCVAQALRSFAPPKPFKIQVTVGSRPPPAAK